MNGGQQDLMEGRMLSLVLLQVKINPLIYSDCNSNLSLD